jgi:transposase
MIDAYKKDETTWLGNYFKRNAIESAWSGLKRRFTGLLHATTDRMRRVEAALKLVVWNVTRLTRLRRRN